MLVSIREIFCKFLYIYNQLHEILFVHFVFKSIIMIVHEENHHEIS
jgi:hypothetical protein